LSATLRVKDKGLAAEDVALADVVGSLGTDSRLTQGMQLEVVVLDIQERLVQDQLPRFMKITWVRMFCISSTWCVDTRMVRSPSK
jgi:hypothetical protein